MMDNLLSLFCLVDGEATSNVFSIKVPSNDTVDDLKKLIKTEKSPAFDDIPADKLTLWRVSIPIVPANKHNPIVLNEIDSPTELSPADDISDVFEVQQPKKTIHIIVQRPSQGNANALCSHSYLAHELVHFHVPVPARPSTPQLKSVPKDHIEQELAVILNGVQHHHTTHPVDPKDAKAYQKRRLGPFFKKTLPYHRTAKDISLVMLGLKLDKKARTTTSETTTSETLHSIVEDDIGAVSGNRVIAMVAPSGSGKTATVIDLATKHFVIYCVCSTPRATVSPDFNDSNFITLATDVERMYMAVVGEEQGNVFSIDEKVKARARERVELEFLARLLFLQLLLNHIPSLKPEQFFLEQTATNGASTIGTLVYKLREYDTLTIEAMLRVTQTKLHSHLVSRRLGLVIAVDEAQVTENDILAGKLISPPALIDYRNNKDAIFDGKNQVQLKYRRGFLTPLSAALSGMRVTLVILGTALSLQNADHVYSALDKTINFTRIIDFPQFDSSDVNKMISDLVDLSDCDIPPAKRRKLSGRARFSLGIIKRLIVTDQTLFSKQATLDSAVDRTIEHVKHDLRGGVCTLLESDKTGEAARLLSRMVLAYHLHDAKISFSSQQQSDFVNKALCSLRQHPDGVHLIMDEPIVVEAVEEELKTSGKDSALMEYLDQLYQIVTNFGVASTSKGDALEPLVRRSLQRFNGLHLVDLPFLQGIALPKWCSDLKLQIDGINTANGLGYTDSGAAADLAFLTECPPNKMLIANFGTRPDGVWFFSDKRYAGFLAIKFYSSSVPQQKHIENETSSDIRSCFLQKDGAKLNDDTLANFRHDFVASGTPSSLRGILRIHIELPDIKNGMPATHVRTDPDWRRGCDGVYQPSNMDDFFFEGIEEHRGDMVKLKKVLRFVCQK
ncbi:hypothetical protein BG003_007388 [Podila horticola]|nr:hypothetical protein BG003_007388 [Podila horticola]